MIEKEGEDLLIIRSKKISSSFKGKRTFINSNKNYNSKLAFFATRNSINISKTTVTIYQISIILISLLLLSLTTSVYSLNCYHCSSVDNPSCDESFTGKDNFTLPADTDCYKHIGREAKVCRKIVQYIEHKKVVIRSCGYIDEQHSSSSGEKEKKSMCYKRSGTFAIMMESCNCYTDNCNHSSSLKPNRSVLIIASFSLIITTIFSKLISNTNKRDEG